MRHYLTAALIFLLIGCAQADAGRLLERYMWQNRLVLIFAPNANSAELREQLSLFKASKSGLNARDILVWDFAHLEHVKLQGVLKPHLGTTPFYKEFDVHFRDFKVMLIGKDGHIKQQWNAPVQPAEIFEIIDAMPMRQREMTQGAP